MIWMGEKPKLLQNIVCGIPQTLKGEVYEERYWLARQTPNLEFENKIASGKPQFLNFEQDTQRKIVASKP